MRLLNLSASPSLSCAWVSLAIILYTSCIAPKQAFSQQVITIEKQYEDTTGFFKFLQDTIIPYAKRRWSSKCNFIYYKIVESQRYTNEKVRYAGVLPGTEIGHYFDPSDHGLTVVDDDFPLDSLYANVIGGNGRFYGRGGYLKVSAPVWEGERLRVNLALYDYGCDMDRLDWIYYRPESQARE